MRKHKLVRRQLTVNSIIWGIIVAAVYAALLVGIGTPQVYSQDNTPTPELEPASVTADDMKLEISRFEIWDGAGNKEPENDVFVILFGTLYNGKNSSECTRARSVRLYLDGKEYRPQNDVMDAVKELIQPQRDFLGAYQGQCIDRKTSAPTFVAFDTPDDFSDVNLEFKGEGIQLAFETSATTVAGTPVPAFYSQPEDTDLAQSIVSDEFLNDASVSIEERGVLSSVTTTFEYTEFDDLETTNWEIGRAMCGLIEAGFTSHNFRFVATVRLVDNFGNISTADGLIILVRQETAAKINCDNVYMLNLEAVADSYYAHPALR